MKQTLFAILEPDLPGATVVDLFAGSGAAGIEALSRGAASAIFVERDGGAVAAIAENLRTTGLAGAATIVRGDALGWLDRAEPSSVDIIVVDPPYADRSALEAVLTRLGATRSPLRAGGRVVAKHFWRDRPAGSIGLLASERERRFGETALTFLRRMDPENARAPSGTAETTRTTEEDR